MGRLVAEEQRVKQAKIRLLRKELAKHQQAARHIAQQLRALGDVQAPAAGWVNWSQILATLPARFTARDVATMAGVRPQHAASVLFGWTRRRLLVRIGRGEYRKRGRG